MATVPDDLRPLYSGLTQSVIISYGEGHGDPPEGDALLVDTTHLRNPPDDPEVRERMLHATGLDPEVRRYVMATPGARELVGRIAAQAEILLDPNSLKYWADGQLLRVDVHVRCRGGRHRSVAIAEEIGVYLKSRGIDCEVEHRHIGRPLLPSSGDDGGDDAS